MLRTSYPVSYSGKNLKPFNPKYGQFRLIGNQQISNNLELPEGFEKGKAVDRGDCFFDSVALGLRQLKPDMGFTVKSLREICKKQALEILDVIAYLASDNIPMEEIFSNLISNKEKRHSAVELLDQYSIANLEHGKLSIHRLVQQVTRIELERQDKEVIKKTFGLLEKSFPYGSDKLGDYIKKKELLPHLETLLLHKEIV